jgi:hypothetical protein
MVLEWSVSSIYVALAMLEVQTMLISVLKRFRVFPSYPRLALNLGGALPARNYLVRAGIIVL